MKRIAFCLLVGLATSVGAIGCAEKTQVRETKQTTTPEGTTTETKTDEVKKTGDNPPPATETPKAP